jgi:ABC-type phosphate transport system auxiliary subunit
VREDEEMPPESSESVNRRMFVQVAASALTGAAVGGEMSDTSAGRSSPHANMRNERHRDGQLYMQTNEIQNAIPSWRV